MQAIIVPEPRAVLLCVQQLLVVLFGRNMDALRGIDPHHFESASMSVKTTNADNIASKCNLAGDQSSGFFERCVFELPLKWREHVFLVRKNKSSLNLRMTSP